MDIIDKVQKILRLAARAGTQEESQAATLRAQELMLNHGLSMSEIDVERATEEEAISLVYSAKRHQRDAFTRLLFLTIANNFRCATMVQTHRWAPKSVGFGFVGEGELPKVAAQTFETALASAYKLAGLFIKERRRHEDVGPRSARILRISFLMGFARGLSEAFDAQVDSMALVITVKRRVFDFQDEISGGRHARGVAAPRHINGSAYDRGEADGRSFGAKKKAVDGQREALGPRLLGGAQ